MSDDRSDKLTAFLAGQLALSHHRTCVKIELEYTPSTGYRPDPIKTWTPESAPEVFGMFQAQDQNDGGSDETALAKLAERRMVFVQRLVGEVISLAEDFADGMESGGAHRFCVRCHEHLGNRATHRFKVLPGFHGQDTELATQQLDPTQTGIVKMLMGHLESKERAAREMMAQFLGAMKHGIETLRDENEALRTQLAARDAKRAEELQLIEDARSKEHDREIELAIVMGERERKDFMIKKFGGLLPAAMSAALRKLSPKKDSAGGVNGHGHAKAAPTPLAQILRQLAMTLTEDQKQQIQGALDIEQLVVLEQIIEDAIDGGGMMLATMIADFFAALRAPQKAALLQILTDPQRALFMKAAHMATTATTQTDTSTATDGAASVAEGAS